MTARAAPARPVVALIDYGSGNLRSAAKAFERAAHEAGLALTIDVTARPEVVRAAERLVLPGVGAFADCMAGLSAVAGLREALEESVRRLGRPFLGICVGLQLMATRGHEHGTHAGLGWLDGDVVALKPEDPHVKIPHMGWNTLTVHRAHPMLHGIETGAHAYFVHSYHLVPASGESRLATTDHGGTITAAVARDNLVGTQFHPEKSQAIGLSLLANFLRWRP